MDFTENCFTSITLRLPRVWYVKEGPERIEEDDLEEEIRSHTIVSSNPHIFGLMLIDQFNFCTLERTMLSQHSSLEPQNQNLPCSYDPRMPNRLYLIARHSVMMCRAYNPEKNSWVSLPAPDIFRKRFSIAACNEQLLAIAGVNNEEGDLKKVEAYDPLQEYLDAIS
ncbi:hypothetical protein AVEN_185349-1 [Araneus ventricosus]|uniref:Uncharacterized protein n=1 Tax=Araneus ventricosus TaxID=182803 RepID=A0A4Y2HRX8_ARAVE|nr:hypothetical protein AVEN_185349-1 [Araneus ventricosus]